MRELVLVPVFLKQILKENSWLDFVLDLTHSLRSFAFTNMKKGGFHQILKRDKQKNFQV